MNDKIKFETMMDFSFITGVMATKGFTITNFSTEERLPEDYFCITGTYEFDRVVATLKVSNIEVTVTFNDKCNDSWERWMDIVSVGDLQSICDRVTLELNNATYELKINRKEDK